MRRGIQRAKFEMGAVFFVTVGISLALVLWGVFFSQGLLSVAAATFQFVVRDLSWFYLIPTNLFLIFVVYVAFSRYGKIKLGKEDEEPEFSRFSWFAMMFQAGMGLAIVFWGVSEPVSHYADPPHGGVLNPSPATKLTWGG